MRVSFITDVANTFDGSYVHCITNTVICLKHMHADVNIEIYVSNDITDQDIDTISGSDLIFLHRVAYTEKIEAVFSRKHDSCKIISYFDDLNFIPSLLQFSGGVRSGLYELSQTHYDMAFNRLKTILESDTLFVSSPKLYEITTRFHPNVLLFENVVEVTKRFIPKKAIQFKCILFMAGTATHDKNLALVEDQLYFFLLNHKDVSLTILGTCNVSNQLLSLSNVIKKDKVDYSKLQKVISSFDLVIAPFEQNIFNDCKAITKFIESASIGVPILSTKIDAYMQIPHKCILVKDWIDWYTVLQDLYTNPEQLNVIAEKAHQFVSEMHTFKNREALLRQL